MTLGTRPVGSHQLDELQGPCCLVAHGAGADQGAVGDDVGHQARGPLATWPRLDAKGPGPGPPQKITSPWAVPGRTNHRAQWPGGTGEAWVEPEPPRQLPPHRPGNRGGRAAVRTALDGKASTRLAPGRRKYPGRRRQALRGPGTLSDHLATAYAPTGGIGRDARRRHGGSAGRGGAGTTPPPQVGASTSDDTCYENLGRVVEDDVGPVAWELHLVKPMQHLCGLWPCSQALMAPLQEIMLGLRPASRISCNRGSACASYGTSRRRWWTRCSRSR